MQNKNQEMESINREMHDKNKEILEKNKKISGELVRLNKNLLKGQDELDKLRGDQQTKNSELQRCIDSIRALEDAVGQEKSRAEATQQSAMSLN